MKQKSPLPAVLARLLPHASPADIMRLDSVLRACAAAHHAIAERECNEFMPEAVQKKIEARLTRRAMTAEGLFLRLTGDSASVDEQGRIRVPSPGQPHRVRLEWGWDARGPGGRLHTTHPDLQNGDAALIGKGWWIIPTKQAA